MIPQNGNPMPMQAPGMPEGGDQMPPEAAPPMRGAPQNGAPESDEALFEEITAGLTEHIFGKGEQGISQQLLEAQDLGDTIGAITMSLVTEGMRQASEAGNELDIDIILGVATEVIDNLIQLADALGVEIQNLEELQKHSLIAAVNDYIMTANPSPEEREAAMFMLQQFEADGAIDEGADELDAMGAQLPPEIGQQPQQQPQQPARPALMGG
jgi:hypothetical protein